MGLTLLLLFKDDEGEQELRASEWDGGGGRARGGDPGLESEEEVVDKALEDKL